MSGLDLFIVALGNNFATTESDIVEMASRLVGTGTQVGMSEAEIMSLATSIILSRHRGRGGRIRDV
jgi:hypothetical protein